MAENPLAQVVQERLTNTRDLEGLQPGEDEVGRADRQVGDAADRDRPHRLMGDEAVVDHVPDDRRPGQRRAEARQQDDHGHGDAAPVRAQRFHGGLEEPWSGLG